MIQDTKKNSEFHRRQRKGSIFYIFAISLGVLVSIICLFIGLGVAGFLAFEGIGAIPIENYLYVLGSAVLPVAYFAIMWVYIGKPRKRVRERYKEASEAQRREINEELKGYSGQHLFGVNTLYFKSGFSVDFLKYSDIAWIYQVNVSQLSAGFVNDVVFYSSGSAPGLIVYDCNGRKYRSPESAYGGLTNDDVEKIKEKAPNAVIGYSKARMKLAKKDFDSFLVSGKNI